ncbi:histidine phosphatase family protein [Porphyromonas levii]|uniref:histidine phosphatase family protein n=1 Tax=Porphyromonas levii TaxID=28114 RepID=UPI001B8BA0F6|nr:histidine phosphatase family protein [Porphyromonas levii]MBR8714075.1 hypothetical protein [Porphyromonas levii]MBR8715903.1 hypothetical protein [Porphyromonas levii]MBR8728610.1 hypothetical protein [Porphyromonas levii]MBR8736928.1 hypothetical protein [Porphyromonas levii]MBR8779017.1 hypothetical protein [Porphyromonas levii]
MLRIDWIRHTSLNITGATCYGQTDLKVADTFADEAAVVRHRLEGRKYDAVFTSPLSRAQDLCIFCGYDEMATRDPRLMERNFGEWELKPWTEVFALMKEQPEKYVDAKGEAIPPSGETVDQLIERVRAFVQEVRRERYRRVAVFCHGGVINSARLCQGLIGLEELFVGVPEYGSVTTLEYAYLD